MKEENSLRYVYVIRLIYIVHNIITKFDIINSLVRKISVNFRVKNLSIAFDKHAINIYNIEIR